MIFYDPEKLDEDIRIYSPIKPYKINSDNDLKHMAGELRENDRKSLSDRNDQYGNILSQYVDHIAKSLKSKRYMKVWFFVISLVIMLAFVLFLIIFCSVIFVSFKDDASFSIKYYLLSIIPVITSFLAVFIIIPKIITKYLFDSKEDYAIRDVISDIQKYDRKIRKNLLKDLPEIDKNK